MIEIEFSGWFECRLATNPDPHDEPRGVSGWTYALPGEPDLDRIIRFQPEGTVGRSGGPAIGVRVGQVRVDGALIAGHPLLNAKVLLQDRAVFEGRGWQVASDAEEPVYPFDIEVNAGHMSLRRAMRNPDGSNALVKPIDYTAIPQYFALTGIADVATYRAARRQHLAERLAVETNPMLKAGLGKRIGSIDAAGASPALMWGPAGATAFVVYDYALEHSPGVVVDPQNVMHSDTLAPWQAKFSCGVWDADALAGFVVGTLFVPQTQ